MAFDIITVTPDLSTNAYADGKVLFESKAIKLPHRKCKLISLNAIWDDTDAEDLEIIVMFFKENTYPIGTVQSGDPNITGDQINSNVSLGFSRLVNDADAEVALGTPSLLVGQHINDPASSTANFAPIVLAEGSTKNTCYMQGFLEVGTSASFGASSLVITLGVEY